MRDCSTLLHSPPPPKRDNKRRRGRDVRNGGVVNEQRSPAEDIRSFKKEIFLFFFPVPSPLYFHAVLFADDV